MSKSSVEQEALLAGLLEAALDPTFIVGQGLILQANSRGAALFGYSLAELVGQPVEFLIPASLRARHQEHRRGFDAQPGARAMGQRAVLDAVRRDGTEFPTDVSLSPIPGVEGNLVLVVVRDVTERERAERARVAAHQESEKARAQFKALLDSIPDFVVVVDAEGRIQFINRVLAPFTLEQLIGTSWRSYVPPEQHAVVSEALTRVLATGVPTDFEATAQSADGTLGWFSNHVGPVRSGATIIGAVYRAHDITERKRTEAQLIVSDRMASVGTLAAGVAHEINNPLAALMANLTLAQKDLGEQVDQLGVQAAFDEVREGLRDAGESADRIRSIVRDLKIFSRSEEDKKEVVDVHRVLDSTLRMAWNEIRHRARLVKTYGELPLVEANNSRLGQVFLNLVVNAAQAIEEGDAEHNEIRVSTRTDAAGAVVVEIADTGSGIPPEVMGRLFTPFFTTKPIGVGTGLGLSICHRIVSGFGGSIDVKSEVGKGTVFQVSLPAAPAESLEAEKVADPGASTATRRGRILVVDDEPLVAKAVKRVLTREHEVLVLTRAEEALLRITAGETFDVVLCDLMMPQMTGMELHAELVKVAPDQARRMIFLTGGAFTVSARAFLDAVPNLRLEKPFDPQALRAVVNDRVR